MNRTRMITLILTVLAPFIGFCDNDFTVFLGSYKSMKPLDHGILITAENAKLEVLHFSPTVIRIRINKPELQTEFSYAVIQQPVGNFKEIKDKQDSLVLLTDSLQVVIIKSPLQVKFSTPAGTLISRDYQDFSISWQGTEVTCYKKLFPNEKFIAWVKRPAR